MNDTLKTYRAKRNFAITPEPAEGGATFDESGGGARVFVIQKHWASRLHYDFRLELDGAMKSWAVPKGPSYDTHDKRMAVQVEDHPISYNSFEGTIPEKQYGAGKVIIWDQGTWQPVGDPAAGYAAGNLKFELRGHKMQGRWVLVRMKGKGEKQPPWLLIKEKDEFARLASEFSVVDEMPDSVKALPPLATEKARSSHVKSQAGTTSSAKPDAEPKAKPSKQSKAKLDTKSKVKAPPTAALPDKLSPQLATLVDGPPSEPADWLFEVKFDGYRLLARVDGKDIRLMTRNGNDWTDKLKPLHAALLKKKLPSGWYDGEIVVHDKQGKPAFGLLQNAFDNEKTGDIVYFVFDLPFCDGHDLRAEPLHRRRELLQQVLDKTASDSVRFSAELDAPPREMLLAACRLGLEGIVGKRRDAPYATRRNGDWIKLKCGQRQEFVIGGYTDPQGTRHGFGSLLLGTYDKGGSLRYAGKVGTGFDSDTLSDLIARLEQHAADASPFAAGRAMPRAHWVKPSLVAEVSFGEWTRAGSIRHAVFHGLRADKRAATIVRELPAHVDEQATHASDQPAPEKNTMHGTLPATLKISNPDRVIDAGSGTTKIDMVRYYALVSGLILPHLKSRPVSLVRAPSGVGGELFFQKHATADSLAGVKQLDPALDPEHAPMLEVATAQGLLSATQWNVVEFHTQNASARNYEKPNRMIFDLDPGKDVDWAQIREAAQLMRAFLEQLGLVPFLKTSGGKGLHVVVPLKPHYDWDTVKGYSQAIVTHMAQTIPERFVQKSGPRNRVGKIFIDYLRNGRGSTTVCAWSARTRPGLGISVPVSWDELDQLHGGDHWTVGTVHSRLDVGNTPWDGYAAGARPLAAAMKKMDYKP